MKNILFVCTGNSCRSVMAEGLFRKLAADRLHEFSVSSAGLSALDGYPSTEQTIRVMKDVGVDVTAHRSRRMTLEMAEAADKIYVMEGMHREYILRAWPQMEKKTHLLAEFASVPLKTGLDIPDPIRMPDTFYKNVSTVIKDCVEKVVQIL